MIREVVKILRLGTLPLIALCLKTKISRNVSIKGREHLEMSVTASLKMTMKPFKKVKSKEDKE